MLRSRKSQPKEKAATPGLNAPDTVFGPSWLPCLRCGGSVPARASACGYCGAPIDAAPAPAALSQLASRIQELTGGAFKVDGLAGCGPHGCTFRARVAETGAAVALKFARLAAGLADETVTRLGETLAAAAAIGHPRLLAATSLQRLREDVVYWTTPLVPDGYGADRLLAAANPPSLSLVSRLLLDVGAALGAAHAGGMPHLALTPAKVILDRAGHAYVADLGIAQGFRGGLGLSGAGAAERAAYAAPEQWSGAGADGRADQYALAVITYELLTGRRRTEVGSVGSVALLPPIELAADARLRPDVPLHVNAALRRALSRRPEHRYATIEDFTKAAIGELDTTPASLPTLHPLVDLTPPRKGWLGAAVATVLLLLAGAAVFGPWGGSEGPLARRARERAAQLTARREADVARPGQQGGGGGGGGAGGGGGGAANTQPGGAEDANAPSFIRVTTSGGGGVAVVFVDGTPRGVAPTTVRVSPGSHTVTLRGGGFGGASRTVTAAAGRTSGVDFSPTTQP